MNAPFLLFLKGMCMGIADVVPGVSGGTMAFILGIYERLLTAIRSFDLQLLRLLATRRVNDAARHIDLAFLLILGSGIFSALIIFTRIIPLPSLILTHPEMIYALFFGLIIASIVILVDQQKPFRPGQLMWIALGIALGLLVVNLVPQQTPTASWFIFLCGVVAICAMILPGISGSFILLILQKYAYVFDAIGRLDFSIIAPFALGCGCGLLLFSHFLGWLLKRFHEATLLTIIGVLIGSLWVIWPFQERVYETIRGKQRLLHSTPTIPANLDWNLLAACLLALAGIVTVLGIHKLSTRAQHSNA